MAQVLATNLYESNTNKMKERKQDTESGDSEKEKDSDQLKSLIQAVKYAESSTIDCMFNSGHSHCVPSIGLCHTILKTWG